MITVNEAGGGDQYDSACMELNEGEILETSVFMDPNETQLPTGIFKFPVNEVMEGLNEEIENDNNVNINEPPSASPKTPFLGQDMIGKRLREYEILMDDLKASTKQKVQAHHELTQLKQELSDHLQLYRESKENLENMQREVSKYIKQVEQFQNEAIFWKTETKKQENEGKEKCKNLQNQIGQFTSQIEQLQNELLYWKTELRAKENNENASSKIKLAETNAILEDLRIKHGEMKERLRESMKENVALKTSKVKKKEAEQGLERLCRNYQEEIEELKRKLIDQEVGIREETNQVNNKLQEAYSAYDAIKGMYV